MLAPINTAHGIFNMFVTTFEISSIPPPSFMLKPYKKHINITHIIYSKALYSCSASFNLGYTCNSWRYICPLFYFVSFLEENLVLSVIFSHILREHFSYKNLFSDNFLYLCVAKNPVHNIFKNKS